MRKGEMRSHLYHDAGVATERLRRKKQRIRVGSKRSTQCAKSRDGDAAGKSDSGRIVGSCSERHQALKVRCGKKKGGCCAAGPAGLAITCLYKRRCGAAGVGWEKGKAIGRRKAASCTREGGSGSHLLFVRHLAGKSGSPFDKVCEETEKKEGWVKRGKKFSPVKITKSGGNPSF